MIGAAAVVGLGLPEDEASQLVVYISESNYDV
jgi:hypothetical protein